MSDLDTRIKWVVLVAAGITSMGTIAGYVGLQLSRPVWMSEFLVEKRLLVKESQRNTRMLLTLVENDLLLLDSIIKEKMAATGTAPVELIEQRARLQQSTHWLNRRLEKLTED